MDYFVSMFKVNVCSALVAPFHSTRGTGAQVWQKEVTETNATVKFVNIYTGAALMHERHTRCRTQVR
eukprot:6659715-Pyramimonas_sp.AAC.1